MPDGFSLNIDTKFMQDLEKVEKKIQDIAAASEKTRDIVIDSFTKMRTQGLDPFVQAAKTFQQEMRGMRVVNLGLGVVTREASAATDKINLLVDALNKLYELYNTCIDHELERLNKTLAFMHTAQSKTINVNTLGSLENYITSVLKRVLSTEDEINKMETQIIEESLFRSSMTSMYYGDPKDEKAKQEFHEEFIRNASTLLPEDSPELQSLKEDGINFIYNNPRQGNDIEGFTLSSKYIWYDNFCKASTNNGCNSSSGVFGA